jgi:hypothetical protein
MSDHAAGDFEGLVRQALAPVDPPDDLAARMELTLRGLSELAADELDSWELASMRDPRNWVRPVAAIAIGTAAGTGLILLRMRQHHKRHRSVRAAAAVEVRRIVRR